jgi:23S rRNA pseudouridine2605 synthase
MKIRLAKAISNKGYCSRRDAEKLILENRVRVNNVLINEVVTFVTPDDDIQVMGHKIIKNQDAKLWIYYKPVGIITTQRDPQGRRTVFEDFPINPDSHIVSVGRLDINSEGLLLITNSKKLAKLLEDPANCFERVYRVRVFGAANPDIMSISKGISIGGINYRPIKITRQQEGINSWYTLVLSEGKNREIRRIFEHFGLSVNRLIRTNYGPFVLGDLKPGQASQTNIGKLEF